MSRVTPQLATVSSLSNMELVNLGGLCRLFQPCTFSRHGTPSLYSTNNKPLVSILVHPFRLGSYGRHRVHVRRRWGLGATGMGTDGPQQEETNKLQSLVPSTGAEDHGKADVFSLIAPSVPWNGVDVAVTMITYFGVFHVPLGVGGLSLVASLLQLPEPSLETKAEALVVLQLLELLGALWLVKTVAREHDSPFPGLLQLKLTNVWGERGWLKVAALGISGLLSLMAVTTGFEYCVPKIADYNNPISDLLNASTLARVSFCFVSCLLAPVLEEFMYRGFLLTSLAAYFGWPSAVLWSSAVFVIAHLQVADFGQLFGLYIVGCVLGTTYVYTGDLVASFVVHAIYNAVLLLKLSSAFC